MKNATGFGFVILLVSMVVGGSISPVFAQDDPGTLLKIAIHAQEHIKNQISPNSPDDIQKLFKESTVHVDALEKSLQDDDIVSAKEQFLSAMKIFTHISKNLTVFDSEYHGKSISTAHDSRDLSNDVQRLHLYVKSLKTIAQNHNVIIDFSELDHLFAIAYKKIYHDEFTKALETIHKIRKSVSDVNKELREATSIHEFERAKIYAQKYLEKLDRLIENAKKQNLSNEIIETLEKSKELLSQADSPEEIIHEIRKITFIKDQFSLTTNDVIESKILQIEMDLSKLSLAEEINRDILEDAHVTLDSAKIHLKNAEFDMANKILGDLDKQLQAIVGSAYN